MAEFNTRRARRPGSNSLKSILGADPNCSRRGRHRIIQEANHRHAGVRMDYSSPAFRRSAAKAAAAKAREVVKTDPVGGLKGPGATLPASRTTPSPSSRRRQGPPILPGDPLQSTSLKTAGISSSWIETEPTVPPAARGARREGGSEPAGRSRPRPEPAACRKPPAAPSPKSGSKPRRRRSRRPISPRGHADGTRGKSLMPTGYARGRRRPVGLHRRGVKQAALAQRLWARKLEGGQAALTEPAAFRRGQGHRRRLQGRGGSPGKDRRCAPRRNNPDRGPGGGAQDYPAAISKKYAKSVLSQAPAIQPSQRQRDRRGQYRGDHRHINSSKTKVEKAVAVFQGKVLQAASLWRRSPRIKRASTAGRDQESRRA